MSGPRQGYVLGRNEGRAIWSAGGLFSFKAVSADTEGRYALMELTQPPGVGAPPHIHHAEDEAFYVLEGEVIFHCGEKTMEAAAGSFMLIPRGSVHSYTVRGTAPGRVLLLFVPGGMEGYFEEMGEPARELALPPRAPSASIMEKRLAVAPKYHVEVVESSEVCSL